MKSGAYIKAEQKVCAPNYRPLPVVLEQGKGAWVTDVEGRQYLDMMSAYSAVSHGHAHPELYQILCGQAQKLTLTSRAFYTTGIAPLLKRLISLSGLEMGLLMNTGAEAVETAIKAARRWGYQVKNIPDNQAEIIVAAGNFHGRTTTVISFSSEPDYKKDFGPLTPGFKEIPFGDSKALEKAITPHTCAFLVEPIQGEGGIIIPPQGWLKEVAEICRHHQVLLILDEIQTGLCRTGSFFAFQHEGVVPDGLILGKALGGGILPLSAFLSHREVLSLMTPGSHGSTFGGNPLACAVGLKALEILERDRLAEKAMTFGNKIKAFLYSLDFPCIKEIRGEGLLIGLELDPAIVTAHDVCIALMKRGILTKETHETVIRLAPPLIIEEKDLDDALQTLQEVLREFSKTK